jgi:hypothetical protein
MDRLEVLRLYKFIEFSEAVERLRENYYVELKSSAIGEFSIRVYLLKRADKARVIEEDLTGKDGFINRLNKELEKCPVKARVEIESKPKFDNTIHIYVFSKVPTEKLF